MRRDKLDMMCAPGTHANLRLEVEAETAGQVMAGVLVDEVAGRTFPIVNGVPSFLYSPTTPDTAHDSQRRTTVTFSDKWTRFKSYGLNPSAQDFLQEWYRKKFGLASIAELQAFYADFTTVLEVGPGSGFNVRFACTHSLGTVCALDISDAAFTTFENTHELPNCLVVQADLMAAPFADNTFDFVMADGVLHHTPNTRLAVDALYRKVKPGGRFFFYVYRKMGAVRQFADRYIRESFTKLEPEACYAACEPITELGKALSDLKATVTLTKPIDILGIPAGTHDVQRLFYYNFLKCFWNDAFDYETNNMVNFDWYHPNDAWQHSETEIEEWMRELGVSDYQMNDANPNGLSVMLRKPA